MPQHDSDPRRESDPKAVWLHTHAKRELCALNAGYKEELYGECIVDEEGNCGGSGWYWWICYPGCLHSPAVGPFATEAEALADAREGMDNDDN